MVPSPITPKYFSLYFKQSIPHNHTPAIKIRKFKCMPPCQLILRPHSAFPSCSIMSLVATGSSSGCACISVLRTLLKIICQFVKYPLIWVCSWLNSSYTSLAKTPRHGCLPSQPVVWCTVSIHPFTGNVSLGQLSTGISARLLPWKQLCFSPCD